VAVHPKFRLPAEEPTDFGRRSWRVYTIAKIAAVVGLIGAMAFGWLAKDEFRRFFFAYLTSFAYFLAIPLGALAFVLVQHVTRAGWSVNVRRVAENIAALLPVMGALSAPIFLAVIMQNGNVYPWALPAPPPGAEAHHGASGAAASSAGEHGEKSSTTAESGRRVLDPLTLQKRPYLNPPFFMCRLVVYFVLWTLISLYFLRHSTQQDLDGDVTHTIKMQKYAAPALVLLLLTLTFAAFDLLMSLDPHWYSTMFGVYYFSGCAVSFFAAIIVVLYLMQRAGFLREAVTVEHYHDLGKFLFAFIFFWGYIAFSQYMLLWYANLPETTTWLARRGASTGSVVPDHGEQWRFWAVLLLVGHLLIPFAGTMSRHVKRRPALLAFWAAWMLVFHWVNMYWVVIPELHIGFDWGVLPIQVMTAFGIGGVAVAAWVRFTAHHKLRPIADPRVEESAVFVNV
jgi:hypothetical protein